MGVFKARKSIAVEEAKEFKLVKITDELVVDVESHEIFEVEFKEEVITGYKMVCRLEYDEEEKRYVVAERNGDVAIGIIEKAKNILNKLVQKNDEV